MIVNKNGKLVTQRAVKKLALIEVNLPDEALDCRWGSVSPDAALCEYPFFDPQISVFAFAVTARYFSYASSYRQITLDSAHNHSPEPEQLRGRLETFIHSFYFTLF